MVECNTVQDEKCEDETIGYTTTKKCQKWPRQECQLTKKAVTKYTTMTGCNKEPTELCAPAGCGFKEVVSVNFKTDLGLSLTSRELKNAMMRLKQLLARSLRKNVS